jgi:transposase
MAAVEQCLSEFAERDLFSQRLMGAPGIGLITATAISASVGPLDRFRSGRHFASWLGITPREHSSGNTRRMGRMSKRGDTYLRLLLIHGARSSLRSATLRQNKAQPLDRLQSWALDLKRRHGHNKAAVALANKMARRLWATERHGQAFDGNHVSVTRAVEPRAASN